MHESTVSFIASRCLNIVFGFQRYTRLNYNASDTVLSVSVLESALGAAFVSHNIQIPAPHLVKKRQHQASIQCSNQQVFWTPHVRSSLECRRVTPSTFGVP
jgi:hypothetical protein